MRTQRDREVTLFFTNKLERKAPRARRERRKKGRHCAIKISIALITSLFGGVMRRSKPKFPFHFLCGSPQTPRRQAERKGEEIFGFAARLQEARPRRAASVVSFKIGSRKGIIRLRSEMSEANKERKRK